VAHRLLMTDKAESVGISADDVLKEILQAVPAPKVR
jgi:hypothetical protein